MKSRYAAILLFLIMLQLFSCQRNCCYEIQPEETEYQYSVQTLGTPNYTPLSNPVTNAGAQLGRVLFYDPQLSVTNATSCGSCHKQENAFADNQARSNGVNGNTTSRNALSIVNVVNETSFFWDGRENQLEAMVMEPLLHPKEMGMENKEALAQKLRTLSYYPELFQKAFGSSEINSDRIGRALAQFLRSMASYRSKADRTGLLSLQQGLTPNPHPELTNDELNGAIQFANCGCMKCHTGPNLRGANDRDSANIGLDKVYQDPGFGLRYPSMNGIFKVPSLRNIAVTAPYMHDGRFKTLEEVLDHYNAHVQENENLSRVFYEDSNGNAIARPRRLDLTETKKRELIAFLQTLTDETLLQDPRFSNPFKK